MERRCLHMFFVFLPGAAAANVKALAHHFADAAGSIKALAFSGDCRWLATAGVDGAVRLYSMNDGEFSRMTYEFEDSNYMIFALAFSSDGRWLAVGDCGEVVRIYSMSEITEEMVPDMGTRVGPRLVHTCKQEGRVQAMQFSLDGRWLAVGTHQTDIWLWTFVDDGYNATLTLPGHRKHVMIGSTKSVKALAFSSDSMWLAAGSEDGAVRVYSMKDQSRPVRWATLKEGTAWIHAVAFSSDGRMLSTGCLDTGLRTYLMNSRDVPELTYCHTDGLTAVNAVAFSGDGKWLATGSGDGLLRLYVMQGDKRPLLWYEANATEWIWTLAFSSDNRWLATGSIDYGVRLYDMHDAMEDPTEVDIAQERARPATTTTERSFQPLWSGYMPTTTRRPFPEEDQWRNVSRNFTREHWRRYGLSEEAQDAMRQQLGLDPPEDQSLHAVFKRNLIKMGFTEDADGNLQPPKLLHPADEPREDPDAALFELNEERFDPDDERGEMDELIAEVRKKNNMAASPAARPAYGILAVLLSSLPVVFCITLSTALGLRERTRTQMRTAYGEFCGTACCASYHELRADA